MVWYISLLLYLFAKFICCNILIVLFRMSISSTSCSSSNGNGVINDDESVLELMLLEEAVKKVQEARRLEKESKDVKVRAAALRAFLADGDEEALALAPPVVVEAASAPVVIDVEKRPEDKGGRANLSDIDGKVYSVFKNSSAVKLLSESQGFRRACQLDRAAFLLGPDGIEIVPSQVLDNLYMQAARVRNIDLTDRSKVWESLRVLHRIENFRVFQPKSFEAFILFLPQWNNDSVLSLQHFVDFVFDEQKLEHIISALRGLELVLCFVFGFGWKKVLDDVITRISEGDLSETLGSYLRHELEAVWNAFCMEMRGRSLDSVGIVRCLGTQSDCVQLLSEMYASVNINLQGQERFLRRSKRKISEVTSRGEVAKELDGTRPKLRQEPNTSLYKSKMTRAVLDGTKSGAVKQVGNCIQHLRHLFNSNAPCTRGVDCHFAHLANKTSVSKSVLLDEVEKSSANMLRDPAVKKELKLAITRA